MIKAVRVKRGDFRGILFENGVRWSTIQSPWLGVPVPCSFQLGITAANLESCEFLKDQMPTRTSGTEDYPVFFLQTGNRIQRPVRVSLRPPPFLPLRTGVQRTGFRCGIRGSWAVSQGCYG